jgi:hypothetical protein
LIKVLVAVPIGALLIIFGLLIAGYVRWYVPRALGRVNTQARAANSGEPTRIDELVASRRWRYLATFALIWSAVMVLSGVALIALGD